MKSLCFFTLLFLSLIILSGCNLSVNKSIVIDDGDKVHGSRNTVNGNIYVGSDCRIDGDLRSVNGGIEIGSHSKVQDLQAVNGRIEVGRETMVRGSIESVNGSVTCDRGVEIQGRLTTVNGNIDLENTIVEHDIKTYNGDITLSDESIVRGDIIIKRSKGSSRRHRLLKIEITNGSVVEGDIIVGDRWLDVKVYLSDGGKVRGRVRDADVIER